MSKPVALLAIDLQNDFIAPSGPTDAKPILKNLPAVLKTIRCMQGEVIWIRSEYPPVARQPRPQTPFPDNGKSREIQDVLTYLQSTHTSSRFCKPGSPGAELHPTFASLVHGETDKVIVKTWYSAFTDTTLQSHLTSAGVKSILIAGVTTNTCVAATAIHASLLGFDTTVLTDCTAEMSSRKRTKALDIMTTHFKIPCTDSTSSSLVDPKLPTLYWVNGSIPSWRTMIALSEKNQPYNPHRLKVMSTPKETRSTSFLAINPRGKTPTYVDTDGTAVIESLALLSYIDTFIPSHPLMPDPTTSKAAYTTALTRIQESENLHNVFEPLELLFVPNGSRIHRTAIIEAYEGTLAELQFWETYLSQTPFVAGECFTLADAALYPILAYLVHRGFELTPAFPSLAAYMGRMEQRRSVREAQPLGWNEPGRRNLIAEVKGLMKDTNALKHGIQNDH